MSFDSDTEVLRFEEIEEVFIKPSPSIIDISNIFENDSFSSVKDWERHCPRVKIKRLKLRKLSDNAKRQLASFCPFNNGSIVADTHFLCYLPGEWSNRKSISLTEWIKEYNGNFFHNPEIALKDFPHIYEETVRTGWWLIYEKSIFVSPSITDEVWSTGSLPLVTDGDADLMSLPSQYIKPNLLEFAIFHYIFFQKKSSRIKNMGAGRISSNGLAVAINSNSEENPFLAVSEFDATVKYSGVGHMVMTRLQV